MIGLSSLALSGVALCVFWVFTPAVVVALAFGLPASLAALLSGWKRLALGVVLAAPVPLFVFVATSVHSTTLVVTTLILLVADAAMGILLVVTMKTRGVLKPDRD